MLRRATDGSTFGMFSTDFYRGILYTGVMTIDDLKTKISAKLASAPIIGARIKFDLGDDGIFLVDGTQSPPTIEQGDGEAETTFICSTDVLGGIVDGTQDPTMAYMMGKLKIQGSMGYALKLNGFLAD
jgi:putative sterol carrier protein